MKTKNPVTYANIMGRTMRCLVIQNCKHCGKGVDLDNEGNTYADGSVAHEHCADGESYRTANESDTRD